MSAGRDRLEGFRQGLGPHFREDIVEHGLFTMASGEAAASRLFERAPDVDGIFVASDLMALGAIGAIRKLGKRVPDDVAIVGFDDIELASMAQPSLTTIRQRTENQGRLMARMLLRQLGHAVADVESESEPDPSTPDGRGIVQHVDLIERESA